MRLCNNLVSYILVIFTLITVSYSLDFHLSGRLTRWACVGTFKESVSEHWNLSRPTMSNTDKKSSETRAQVIMASHKISIPIYNPDRSYEVYRSELELWESLSDLPDEKKGAAVALTLPDTDKCSLRSTVLEKLGHSELIKSTGLKSLKDLLDELLGKDDLEECLSRYEDFEDYSRTTESIDEYIRVFDTKYIRIKNKGITLPAPVLAFKLLRNASITPDDRKLVLTGLNYAQKEQLFEQAKQSLKKYCGTSQRPHILGTGRVKVESQPSVKQEVFSTDYYTPENRFQRGRGRGSRPMRGRERGSSRGFWPHQRAGRQGGSQSSQWRGADIRGRVSGERHMNPLGVDGKPMLCNGCGSYRHFLETCPESWENIRAKSQCDVKYVVEEAEEYEPYRIFLTGHDPSELSAFVAEAQNCAVLDTACGRTVCGTQWFDAYRDQIDSADIQLIEPQGSCKFKFGAGPLIPSLGTYGVPITMAGVDMMLTTDVVDCDIPLLLSKSAMKSAGIVIDMNDDSARIFGKTVPLDTTTSGHYCVPIKVEYPVSDVSRVMSAVTENESVGPDMSKTLLKLHRQFGHPSQNKLVTLLKDAGLWDECYKADLDKVYQKCRSSGLCRFKDRIPRPVAALPLAHDFNDKVALDLKQWNGKWILHMVDMWSRFTISTLVPRKCPSDIIHAVMSEWCSIFGVMGGVLTDNGGEFVSKEMIEVESLLNVEVLSTAAESPFQNGICEQNHQVVDTILTKLVHDFPRTPVPILLKWACLAKNTLQMYEGFSSYQLVFGRNPNLPNIITGGPSVLEETCISEKFIEHLNSLHAARQAFVQSESCCRIKRALKSKIRTNEQVFQPGDLVYYKRDSCEKWLGPAKVIFQDGKIVFVRHGAFWVKVSLNRLVKSGKEFASTSGLLHAPEVHGGDLSSDSDSDNDVEHRCATDTSVGHGLSSDTASGEADTSDKTGHGSNDQTMASENLGPSNAEASNDNQDNIDSASDDHAGIQEEGVDSGDNIDNAVSSEIPVRRSLRQLNQKHGWQVYCGGPALPICEWQVFMSDVPIELHDSPECAAAKLEELRKLSLFDVYEEVADNGQPCIGTKWVITYKGAGVKARIVARGFQETQYVPSDSPTVAKTAFRTVLAIAASHGWVITTTDIKSAFLQGNFIDRDVYLRPPKEAGAPVGVIWKLKKSLYGLYDGARQFYLSVHNELTKLGCAVSSVDPSVFYYVGFNGQLAGVLISHVDDFLHAGGKDFDSKIMDPLRKRFVAGKIEAQSFKYVGFDITQDTQGISVSMDSYLNKTVFDVIKPGEKDRDLTEDEKSEYRSLVGRLNWVVQGARPDKSYEVTELSMRFKIAKLTDLKSVKRTLRQLKDNGASMFFPALTQGALSLAVYTDAGHANLSDGVSSTSGVVVFLADQHRKVCPLSWRGNKIRRVVKSSLAAETLALQEGVEEALYLRKLLTEMCPNMVLPIDAYVDNKSLVDALRSTKLVSDRRLRIDIGVLRQTLEQDIRSVEWISGAHQLANCMTKKGACGASLLAVFQSGRLPDPYSY